ncbi:pseudouridine synthase [Helicobacter vulpis]|uniref:pseudouridine synthase n=1 Tax=Helicobacter vulpis TaxID=2316076 RepID=UPI000EB27C34|nr:pseudouridine synthase [Helicobacter vulpis]
MRLNQFVARYLHCSRRQADALIGAGKVKINHQIATFTTPFNKEDKIFVEGKLLKIPKAPRYSVVIYHKPKGELVARKDDRARPTIFESLDRKFAHFIPVGRLDFASSGLLLLSDHSGVVSALMHSALERVYLLKIEGPITPEILEGMQTGIHSHKGAHPKNPQQSLQLPPFARYDIIKNHPHFSKLKITLTEGKNRELRRFFAHFDRAVLDLKRVSYGFAHLNALPEGKTRYLNPKEYQHLYAFLKEIKL